jgi:acyl carrier protein/NADP-dependent 3-hydroxy acid dehydrogenase YdfG
VTDQEDSHLQAEAFDSAQNRGLLSLFHLAKIFDQEADKAVRMLVVSNGMQEVNNNEGSYPEKALLLGAVKVIPNECQNIDCGSVDILLSQVTSNKRQLIDQLIGEFSQEKFERAVAYRGDHRWAQTFEPLRLEERAKRSLLKEGGVYLITGGFGEVGLALASHLAAKVKAKIVLLGRSAFPAQSEWQQWLERQGEQDSISGKILKLRAIEALGGAVLTIKTDVANQEELSAAVEQVEKNFGRINGVIHAANTGRSKITQLETEAGIKEAYGVKAKSLYVLNKVFKDRGLDFLALCSSIASVTAKQYIGYCAANAFLDAAAGYNNAHNGPCTIAINWDAWHGTVMIETMALPQHRKHLQEEYLKRSMLTEEAVAAFDRILSNPFSQIVVSTTDLEPRIKAPSNRANLLEKEEKARGGASYQRPQLGSPYVAPTNWIEEALVNIWQDILGVQQIGINDNFFELGGHSLTVIQILSRIGKEFDMTIAVDQVFNAPTIAGLGTLILQRLAENQELSVEDLKEILENEN